MHILIHIISPILISLSLSFVYSKIYKSNGASLIQNINNKHIVIRLPKAYFGIGSLGIVVFSAAIVLMTLYPNDSASWWVYFGFSLFVLLGVFLIAYTLIWKIDIFRCEDYFTYRTFWGRTHKIKYSECISYKYTEYALTIKTFKQTLNFDSKATNIDYLVAMLRRNKVERI